jgi:hypothetical protein
MKFTPFVEEYIERLGKSQGPRTLTRVKGCYTPEGLTYRGKRIRPGVFVNITGRSEKEKERLFALAREELGEQAKGLEDW